MKAYSYHPHTGESIGQVECQPSPREAGVHLVPGHATIDPPPVAGEHQVAVRIGQAWEMKPDYRRLTYWHKRRPWETYRIEEIDVYPDAEWTDQDPAQVDLRFVQWDDGLGRWVFDEAARAAAEQADANAKARAYLQETDWMVVRAMEGGKPVPADVTAKREAARAAVKE